MQVSLEIKALNFSNALELLGIERMDFVADPEKTIEKASGAIEQMGYHNDTAFYANFDVERQLHGIVRMVSSMLKHINNSEAQEN